MQNQFPLNGWLGIQRLLQCTNGKLAGNMPVCNAGDHAPVIEIYDAAIVSHFMVLQEQICEICAPFLIPFIRSKVLFDLVFKHFMCFSMLIIRLFATDNRLKPKFRIHIFMYGCGAVVISFPSQIDCHASIAINTVVFMIDFLNLCLNFRFMGIISCLSVFSVVIVSVWMDFQSPEQPTDAEYSMMLLNESISL